MAEYYGQPASAGLIIADGTKSMKGKFCLLIARW